MIMSSPAGLSLSSLMSSSECRCTMEMTFSGVDPGNDRHSLFRGDDYDYCVEIYEVVI